MAVAFGSISGTTYASRTNTTVVAPTGISNGDVLIAQVLTTATGGGTPPAVTTPAGWSAVDTAISTGLSGFNMVINLFKKVASSESGDYTFTHGASTSQGTIARYSGANGTVNASSKSATVPANTTRTWTGITTTVANCMIVATGFDWADTANNLTPPTGMTERLDNTLSYWSDVIKATAGATGDYTQVCNATGGDPRGGWLIALEPSGGTGVTVNVTGNAGTASVGAETVTAAANVSPTGNSATSSVGTVVIPVLPLGQSVTTSVGTVSIVAKAGVSPTGNAGTSAVGNVAVSGKANVAVTGSAATASVGDVTVSIGGGVSVNVTGQSVAASVGTVAVTGKANVSSTGNVGTSAVGSVVVAAAAGVSPTGNSVTASVGSVATSGKANVSPTGNVATSAVGSVTVSIPVSVSVNVTGNSVTVSVGTVIAGTSTGATVSVTGQSVTASVGNVTVVVKNVTVSPIGLSMNCRSGRSTGWVSVNDASNAQWYPI